MKHYDTDLIRDVLAALDAEGEQYRILPPHDSDAAVRWLAKYPEEISGQISWVRIPGSACLDWVTDLERVGALAQMAAEKGVRRSTVIVIWGNAIIPCLELPMAAAVRHAEAIFDAASDTWIACPEEGWCIEVWHEGVLSFGYLPPR